MFFKNVLLHEFGLVETEVILSKPCIYFQVFVVFLLLFLFCFLSCFVVFFVFFSNS